MKIEGSNGAETKESYIQIQIINGCYQDSIIPTEIPNYTYNIRSGQLDISFAAWEVSKILPNSCELSYELVVPLEIQDDVIFDISTLTIRIESND